MRPTNDSSGNHLFPTLTLAQVAEHLNCSKAQVSNLTNGKVAGVPKLLTVKYGKLCGSPANAACVDGSEGVRSRQMMAPWPWDGPVAR